MSSISALSGLGSLYPSAPTTNSQGNNPFSEFEQLASALQSGNLSAAQQAYNTIAQMMPNASNGPAGSAFQALGQALQSGNLSAAQQAFSTMQQDFAQGIMGHHHHHGGGEGGAQLLSELGSDNTTSSILNPSSSTTSNSIITNPTTSTDGTQTSDQTLLNLLA